MPVEIRLKRKYIDVGHAKKVKGDYAGNNNKKRVHLPLTTQQLALIARQPKMVMRLTAKGKRRMEVVSGDADHSDGSNAL